MEWLKGPEFVRHETRICFSLMWYDTEEKADEAARLVREFGCSYNGGWSHGMPCGRERSLDRVDEHGRRLYAVSY